MDKAGYSADPKALFLGPYSENQHEFRRLTDLLLSDIIQWRRNYHPHEQRLIQPTDKESKPWKETFHKLESELDILLGELKQSIPFHNPRFIGHMHSDLVLPALLGYMAGQLYNQNNVVGESSPVTSDKEVAFICYLSEMIGYPPCSFAQGNHNGPGKASYGHLTSGGTTANIEALWVARNVKYFPLSLKLFLQEEESLLTSTSRPDGWRNLISFITGIQIGDKLFKEHTAEELFNLSPETIFDLHSRILDFSISSLDNVSCSRFNDILTSWLVRRMGVWGIHTAIQQVLKEDLSLPCLVVPQSRHYSWEKAMDILGMGASNIRYVPVDSSFRIVPEDFYNVCNDSKHILMAVAVVGTTEEGVIDPIDALNTHHQTFAREGKGFWFHIDAAYGGYYAAMFRGYNVEDLSRHVQHLSDRNWVDQGTWDDIQAICHANSFTIDPHKMGYIPYSAGAILYKDKKARNFIDNKPPYLSSGSVQEEYDATKLYLGGSSLEGSRSGAAALACYLSSRVLPADINGYGKLVRETFINASTFIELMPTGNEAGKDSLFNIRVYPLYDALSNIVCYAVGFAGILLSPDNLNKLNTRLYEEMSAGGNKLLSDYPFIISRTSLRYNPKGRDPGYQSQINGFLRKFDINPDAYELITRDFELVLLRSTLMNPMLDPSSRERIFGKYFDYVRSLANKVLPEILLEDFLIANGHKRLRVLWLENQARVKALSGMILKGSRADMPDISRFLDIEFSDHYNHERIGEYQLYIVDLNLANSSHKEWSSGISAIRKIREANKDAIIMVYSQFLNHEFIILRQGGETVNLLNGIKHHKIIQNYMEYHFGLTSDHLIPKTTTTNTGEVIPEMTDLNKITRQLARIVYNHKSALLSRSTNKL